MALPLLAHIMCDYHRNVLSPSQLFQVKRKRVRQMMPLYKRGNDMPYIPKPKLFALVKNLALEGTKLFNIYIQRKKKAFLKILQIYIYIKIYILHDAPSKSKKE